MCSTTTRIPKELHRGNHHRQGLNGDIHLWPTDNEFLERRHVVIIITRERFNPRFKSGNDGIGCVETDNRAMFRRTVWNDSNTIVLFERLSRALLIASHSLLQALRRMLLKSSRFLKIEWNFQSGRKWRYNRPLDQNRWRFVVEGIHCRRQTIPLGKPFQHPNHRESKNSINAPKIVPRLLNRRRDCCNRLKSCCSTTAHCRQVPVELLRLLQILSIHH